MKQTVDKNEQSQFVAGTDEEAIILAEIVEIHSNNALFKNYIRFAQQNAGPEALLDASIIIDKYLQGKLVFVTNEHGEIFWESSSPN